jgi:hypothetical protein
MKPHKLRCGSKASLLQEISLSAGDTADAKDLDRCKEVERVLIGLENFR